MIDSICEESSTTGASSAVSSSGAAPSLRPRVLSPPSADRPHSCVPCACFCLGAGGFVRSNAVCAHTISLVAACRSARRLRRVGNSLGPQGGFDRCFASSFSVSTAGLASIGACASSFWRARVSLRLAIGLSTTLLGRALYHRSRPCMTRACSKAAPSTWENQEGASGQILQPRE